LLFCEFCFNRNKTGTFDTRRMHMLNCVCLFCDLLQQLIFGFVFLLLAR